MVHVRNEKGPVRFMERAGPFSSGGLEVLVLFLEIPVLIVGGFGIADDVGRP